MFGSSARMAVTEVNKSDIADEGVAVECARERG
jgi:hypothetical protein